METSTSSALISHFVNTIVLNFNIQIVINLILYSAAATTGVVTASKIFTLLLDELIKVIHYRWETRYRDKRKLSMAVMKICTEGSVHAYTVEPRDYEHIYYIADSLKAVDESVAKLFDTYMKNWSIIAIEYQNAITLERQKSIQEWRDDADKARENILKIIGKWR